MLEQAPPMDVRTSRRFKRSAPLGMKIIRSMTVNFDCKYTVEHVETECPDYELTPNGPVHKEKTGESDE